MWVETPEKITDSFPIAAQVAKGPDIVIWVHDKVGEWADVGLIFPVEVSDEFVNKFYQKLGRVRRSCISEGSNPREARRLKVRPRSKEHESLAVRGFWTTFQLHRRNRFSSYSRTLPQRPTSSAFKNESI
jgi:hypothetical protein